MEQVTGVVESKRRDGNAIRVNGEWYGTYKGKGLESVNWQDQVSFLFEKDKSGRYNNIKGTVKVLAKGAAPARSQTITPSSNGRPVYSNLGVELGHASKLALDIAIHMMPQEVGSSEFYRCWIEQTEKVYRGMQGLRSAYEKKEAAKSEPADIPDADPFESEDEIDPFAD